MGKIEFSARADDEKVAAERPQFLCEGIIEAGCPRASKTGRGKLSDGTWSRYCEDCTRDFKEAIRQAQVRAAVRKGELPF